MEDRGPCLFISKLTELQLFQVEKYVLNEGQNQSEPSLLTVKPMASTTLNSISHNTPLILMNKKQLLRYINSRYLTDKPSAGLWISTQAAN